MISKKTLLGGSGIGAVILLILNQIGTFKLCGGREYGHCMDVLYGIIVSFLPILPLFLFSIITYKMRDEVSRAWMRFSIVWIPLSIILSYLTPESSGGGFGPSISIGKGDTALIMSALFVIISLLIIAWKYFATRKQ